MKGFKSTSTNPYTYTQSGVWKKGQYTFQAVVLSDSGYAFAFQRSDTTWQTVDLSWQVKDGSYSKIQWTFTLEVDAVAFRLIANTVTGETTVLQPMLEKGSNGSTPIAHEEDLRGMDGDNHEFIFTRNTTGIAPETPLSTQDDDYVPEDWTDNAQGVTSEIPFEFVSMRERKNGVWLDFSPPSLWAKWGEDGLSVNLLVEGHYNSHWEGITKVVEIVGGVDVGGNEVVKVSAVFRKGEENIAATVSQSRGFQWYVNGVHLTAFDNQPFITLDETYGDGFADYVVLSYLVNSIREEERREIINISEGMDGIGEEFIFKANNSDTEPPVLPQTSDTNYQDDDYYGQGTANVWNDDPVAPTKMNQFVWAAKRKKIGGIWEAFGTPSVWTKWVEDGNPGDPGEEGDSVVHIYKQYPTQPATPSSGVLNPTGWSRNPDYSLSIVSQTNWTFNGKWYQSEELTAVGNSSTSRITFTTYKAAQTITLELWANGAASYDYVYAGKLDTAVSTSNYYNRVLNGKIIITYDVPTAGSHYIDIFWRKGIATIVGSNRGYYAIISDVKVWRSVTSVIGGVVQDWSEPKQFLIDSALEERIYCLSKTTTAPAISDSDAHINDYIPLPCSLLMYRGDFTTNRAYSIGQVVIYQFEYYKVIKAISSASTRYPTDEEYFEKISAWVDNPVGANKDYPFEFVAIRKKQSDGLWGPFVPSVWSTWGASGHSPYIDETTKTWWTWDEELEIYTDTGMKPVGAEGRIPYPAGYWEAKTYTRDANYAPYVQHTEAIYLLVDDIAEDTDVPGTSNKWKALNHWQAIFVDSLVAKFAQIGGAVFTGDTTQTASGIRGRLISEMGVNGTTNFKSYTGDSGAWQPKLMLDFLNGRAKIEGEVVATSGKIGGLSIDNGKLLVGDVGGNRIELDPYNRRIRLINNAEQLMGQIVFASGDTNRSVGAIIELNYLYQNVIRSSIRLGGFDSDVTIRTYNSSGVEVGETNYRHDGMYIDGQKVDMGGGGGSGYVLPTASQTTLGGVKIGSNISISNGVISVAAPYTHPSTHPASMISAGTLGGIVKANNNASYTTKQVRNMILSTGDADSSQMENGDIWIKYV